MTSEAQKKASQKWATKKSNIAIRLDPEFKKEIDEHIACRNEKLSEFIVRSIKEQIVRDKNNEDSGS